MRLQNRKKEKKNVEKGNKRHKLEGNQRLGEVKSVYPVALLYI